MTTSLDDLPFLQGEPSPPTNAGVRLRPHRHRWELIHPGYSEVQCALCRVIRDETAARRGKQSRNYGNRAELDVARRYGGSAGRKIGHAGGPVDVVTKTASIQVKTMRREPPAMWRKVFAGLDTVNDGRAPWLLLRFVRPGHPPEDFFVIRGRDKLLWYGNDDDAE